MTAADDSRKAASAGYSEKAAWFDDIAEGTLSLRAKYIGERSAWKKAGHKGHFRATMKEIAAICGVSVATAERAVAELKAQHYWTVDNKPGANIYTLVPPSERAAICNRLDREKRAWEWRVNQYLDKKAEDRRLAAEAAEKEKFTMAVYGAIIARGGAYIPAANAAERAWKQHQNGAGTVEAALQAVAAMSDEQISASFPWPERAPESFGADPSTLRDQSLNPAGPVPQPCGTDPSTLRDRSLTPDPLTSANDQSHKYFKSVKDEEVLHTPATTRADGARSADAQGTTTTTTTTVGRPTEGVDIEDCGLCDADGVALCVDPECGHQVELTRLDEWDVPTDEVKLFRCRHSRQGNFDALSRAVASGEWSPNWTGYATIDGPDDFEEIGETFAVDGIMDEARSRESVTQLGHSE